MAIYKGREVQLLSAVPQGYTETQNVTVVYNDGTTELAKLNTIQFTKSEKDKIQKDAGSKFDNVQVIEDKDYQELKDGQDPKKNEERMKSNPVAPATVVNTREVDSDGQPLNKAK